LADLSTVVPAVVSWKFRYSVARRQVDVGAPAAQQRGVEEQRADAGVAAGLQFLQVLADVVVQACKVRAQGQTRRAQRLLVARAGDAQALEGLLRVQAEAFAHAQRVVEVQIGGHPVGAGVITAAVVDADARGDRAHLADA
jgi:hypothetical protein